jgi:hypothetical protein
MVRLLPIALVLAVLGAAAAQDRTSVRGRVVVDVEVCCGGAAAEPGTDCTTEESYSGEVTFRHGRRNRGRAVARVTTDDGGRFRVSLPPGTYCVGAADRAFSDELGDGGGAAASGTGGGSADPECLERRRRGCDAIVTVPSSRAVVVHTDQPCFGHCYRGPWPG